MGFWIQQFFIVLSSWWYSIEAREWQFSAVVMADDIVLSLPWKVQFYGYFSIIFSCIGCALPIDTKAGFCQYIYSWVYITVYLVSHPTLLKCSSFIFCGTLTATRNLTIFQVELDLAVKEVILPVCIRQDNFEGLLCRAGHFVPVQFAEYCSFLSACSLTVLRTGTGYTNGSTVKAGQDQAFKCVSRSFDVLRAFASVRMVWCKYEPSLIWDSKTAAWDSGSHIHSVVRDFEISASNWRICPKKVLNHLAQRGTENSWGSWQTCHLGMCTACC